MRRLVKLSMLCGALGLLAVATGYATDTTDTAKCQTLASEARFFDLSGNEVALSRVDAIALEEIDQPRSRELRRPETVSGLTTAA